VSLRDALGELRGEVAERAREAGTFRAILEAEPGRQATRVDVCFDVLGAAPAAGEVIHAVSIGEFSAIHVIGWAVDALGPPAEVYCSTWAVSAHSAKALGAGLDAGLLSKVRCVIDPRGSFVSQAGWPILRDVLGKGQYARAATHAKAYAITGARGSLSVVTSANLNGNPRIEQYTITGGREAFDYHRGWIEGIIDRTDPFEAGEKQWDFHK